MPCSCSHRHMCRELLCPFHKAFGSLDVVPTLCVELCDDIKKKGWFLFRDDNQLIAFTGYDVRSITFLFYLFSHFDEEGSK